MCQGVTCAKTVRNGYVLVSIVTPQEVTAVLFVELQGPTGSSPLQQGAAGVGRRLEFMNSCFSWGVGAPSVLLSCSTCRWPSREVKHLINILTTFLALPSVSVKLIGWSPWCSVPLLSSFSPADKLASATGTSRAAHSIQYREELLRSEMSFQWLHPQNRNAFNRDRSKKTPDLLPRWEDTLLHNNLGLPDSCCCAWYPSVPMKCNQHWELILTMLLKFFLSLSPFISFACLLWERKNCAITSDICSLLRRQRCHNCISVARCKGTLLSN